MVGLLLLVGTIVAIRYFLLPTSNPQLLTPSTRSPFSPQSSALSNPNSGPGHFNLAVIYSELGQEAEARAEVAEMLRVNPKMSLEWVKQTVPFKDPTVLERTLAALRKAGLK